MPRNFLLVVRLRDIKFTTMKEEKIAHLQIFLSNKKSCPHTRQSSVNVKKNKKCKKKQSERFASVWQQNMNWSNWVRLLEREKKDYETTRAEWSWGKQRNNLQFVELTFACVGATWERAWKVGKFSSHTHSLRISTSWNFLLESPPWKLEISTPTPPNAVTFCVFFSFHSLSALDIDSQAREKNCFQSQSKHRRDYIAILVSEYDRSMWNSRK